MANVFLSWGSPHEQEATTIAAALRQANVSVWLSTDGMRAGQDPYVQVDQEISQADTAVFLLSRQVIDRDWVRRELEWAAREALRRPKFRILPFYIGTKPGAWPAIIRDRSINVEEVTNLDEPALGRILRVVRDSVGLPEPVAVLVALFAMTEDDFAALAAGSWNEAARLCVDLGMREPLISSLRHRYAASVDGFKPFGTRTLKEILERVVYRANTQKAPTEPPILLEWCTQDRLRDDKELQDRWASESTLLFIDSISLASECIRDGLLNLTWPEDRAQSSVVWIPPYSAHTAGLEEGIGRTISQINWLRQAFTAFVDVADARRAVAFDLVTPATLDHWLLRLLARPLRNEPSPAALREMALHFAAGGAMNPVRDFHTTRGGAR